MNDMVKNHALAPALALDTKDNKVVHINSSGYPRIKALVSQTWRGLWRLLLDIPDEILQVSTGMILSHQRQGDSKWITPVAQAVQVPTAGMQATKPPDYLMGTYQETQLGEAIGILLQGVN